MPPRIEGECHDTQARTDLADIRHELRNYRAVNDLKGDNLRSEMHTRDAATAAALAEIKSLMKWAGSLIISLIIGVLGWSLVQQYQANEQQKKELESQLRILQEQERSRIISAPSASQPADPAAR